MTLREINNIAENENLELIDYGVEDYALIGLLSLEHRDELLKKYPQMSCGVVVKRPTSEHWDFVDYADYVELNSERCELGDDLHFVSDADNYLAQFDPDEQDSDEVKEAAKKIRTLAPGEVAIMAGDVVYDTLQTRAVSYKSESGWQWELALIAGELTEESEPTLVIKEAIAAAGLTQAEVAARMGKSPNTLAKIIANGNPSFTTLVSIAKAIGCQLSDLMTPCEQKLKAEIDYKGEHYSINSVDELVEFVENIE